MPYVTQSQIQSLIPGPTLVDALDDDRDGAADAGQLDAIIAQASQAVDALLAGVYAVPFANPVPAAVREAAFVFACELIYGRRAGTADNNPFAKRGDAWRAQLKMIADHKNLDSAIPLAFSPGAAIVDSVALDTNTR